MSPFSMFRSWSCRSIARRQGEAWLRLSLEALEPRLVLDATIHIDANWLQLRGPAPYVLDQAGTTYILDTNVDVPAAAFIARAPNIVFDLNGHQVVYGDSARLTVVNGDWSQGATASDVPGWTLSGPATPQRLPALTGMSNPMMLELYNINAAETLVSSPVAIPVSNRNYVVSVTPRGSSGATLVVSVIDAVTNARLGSASLADLTSGYGAVVSFTPTTIDPVKIKIDVYPPGGQGAWVDLDGVLAMTAGDYGILATAGTGAGNFTLKNGSVLQGQAQGYASYPLDLQGLGGFTVDGVTTYSNGMDTDNLYASWANYGVIRNSTFNSDSNRVSNRQAIISAIKVLHFGGTMSILGNRISRSPQAGILAVGDADTQQGLTINNNVIQQRAIVTDGYGIFLAGVRNFEVANNQVIPIKGRGIIIDGWDSTMVTQNGAIHDNYVSVYEEANLEYAANALEATALRLRNWSSSYRNLHIYNNTFIATTGLSGVHEAIGVRITAQNDSGQMNNAYNQLKQNTIKAIATTGDSQYSACALSFSGVDAGTGWLVAGNVLESNDTSLRFGDNDSWRGQDDDIFLVSNTLRRSNDGAARSYTSIIAGAWENEVSNIRLLDTRYENGATSAIDFEGSRVNPAAFGVIGSAHIVVTGADAGGGPDVRIFEAKTGQLLREFFAYDPAFRGGVRIALGDVDRSGDPEIIAVPGPGGGPDVRVFDAWTGQLLHEFMAYDPSFRGGLYVAAGDVNGDGFADVITGADAGGGPHVKVFSGASIAGGASGLLWSFMAYDPSFRGGVRVAAADLNGDGKADIITAPGPGGGPHVKVFDGTDVNHVLQSFMAFDPSFSGGLYVAAGDINGDGKPDIIIGAGAGGGPHVKVFEGSNPSQVLQSFMAYDAGFRGGVRVGCTSIDASGHAAIVTAPGQLGGPQVRVRDGLTLQDIDSFFAYDPTFTSGVFVGAL